MPRPTERRTPGPASRTGLRTALWMTTAGVAVVAMLAALHAGGDATRSVLAEHDLAEHAALGGRFTEDPPTLAWICFHGLQEYARHAGHLDVAAEIAGGATGE